MTQSRWKLSAQRPGTGNLFNLIDPDIYRCRLLYYTTSHSWLTIALNKVNKNNETLYLIFNNVTYFDGPMRWDSANFCLAPTDDWINVMITRIYEGFSRDSFREIHPEQSELVVIYKTGYLIQIVATDVELTEDFNIIRNFI